MEENNKNNGQGLGVASLILGIVSFVVAFIPCVGILALFTAAAAIVLGAIGLSQASRAGSQHRGMNIGGLIVGIIALFVSVVQVAVIVGISENVDGVGSRIEEIVGDIQKDILDEIDNGNFKISIEDEDQKVEINASSNRDDLLDKLDELEGSGADTVKIEITRKQK
ncbi:MAG: DUF4190 domain-containing protein [Bacteroidales bacterium]